ncbi:Deoxyuridine 5'-triphosphate nucleotidohydrolase [Rhodococcus sp. AW25M09]|nr:Deoxyuridine 5'-triphosphate nucleotidohydrolase [Rhodococcus sp. AW25M09]
MDLVDRGRARLDGGVPCVVQRAERFDLFVFRHRVRSTRLRCACREVGVDGVGFADSAPFGTVGSSHFYDGMPALAGGSGEPGTVGAGAFDTDAVEATVLGDEGQCSSVAGGGGGEFAVVEISPLFVDDCDVDRVGVSVDAGDDLVASGSACHAGNRLPSRMVDLGRVGRQDSDEALAKLLLGHVRPAGAVFTCPEGWTKQVMDSRTAASVGP